MRYETVFECVNEEMNTRIFTTYMNEADFWAGIGYTIVQWPATSSFKVFNGKFDIGE